MSGKLKSIDVEQARKNPTEWFEHPAEVLEQPGLGKQEKIEILRQWEYDTLQLQVATEENMPPMAGKQTSLAEVREALESLGVTHEQDTGGSKFG